MKRKKLLEKLNTLLSASNKPDAEQVRKLRKVLKALKEKQNHLQAELAEAEGEHERRKLTNQIEVIRRQREKGVEVYKSIKGSRQ